jgi:2-polyprenyl-3-methyl-5-hydroxy-6-metoxy-1,4-benzoquinol methylase
MDKRELKAFVDSRSWYQTIKFEDDVVSRGCAWCGEPAWSNMIKLLPESLEGKRVLDLGHNAGLFCVRSALMGAEAVGIDWEGWRPNWDFIEQADFVKQYFEQKHNKKFNIKYISGKMEEVLLEQDLGKFDYVYVMASIYYTKNPREIVNAISNIAENVIVRLRDGAVHTFPPLFRNHYKEVRVIREEWWKVLNRKTDDFYLYLYSK